MARRPRFPRQVLENMSLYYVCYRLSREGWNVLPTTRSEGGPNLVLLDGGADVHHAAQVRALTKRYALEFGTKGENDSFDFLVVCMGLDAGTPTCYILTREEVEATLVTWGTDHQLFLEPRAYARKAYQEKWDRIPRRHS